ncbi:MAG: cell division protein FtsQ/DivIB, partial [Thermodesulfovibrionales bacterium]
VRNRARAGKMRGIRRKVFMVSLVVFVLASVGVAGRLFLRKVVVFPVAHIDVVGNRHLGADEVVQLAGLREGIGIFAISSESVAQRLKKSPWIEESFVRKELPDRVLIRVDEASPAALLKKRREYYLVDSEGNILEQHRSAELFLPVILGDSLPNDALREAVALAAVLRRYPLGAADLPEIVCSREGGLSVRMGTQTIRFGYGDYDEKIRRFIEIRDEIQRRGLPLEYVDLRYDRRVVVRASGRDVQ